MADLAVSPEGSFLKALIEAKKGFKPLVKSRINPFYKSKYADLSDLHEAVDEALAKNGLAVSQPIGFDGERFGLTTKLAHVAGHKETSFWPLPGGVKPQELAAAITYGRRVSLSALLGIASEDDDDGNAVNGHPIDQTAKKAAKPQEEPKNAGKPPSGENSGLWSGTLNLVTESEQAGKKYTKVIGQGGEQFAIMADKPEFAKKAGKAIDKKSQVTIKYHLTPKGTQIVDHIEVSE